jgi:hypothetical protein
VGLRQEKKGSEARKEEERKEDAGITEERKK